MKKTLILNILLVIIFALLLGAFIFVIILNNLWNEVGSYIVYVRVDILDTAKEYENMMFRLIIPEVFFGIATLIDLIVLAVIDIPLIKSKFNKTNLN